MAAIQSPRMTWSDMDNLKWVFDGIGVAVIVLILGVIGYFIKRRTEKRDLPEGAKSETASIVQKGNGVATVQQGQTGSGHVINVNAPVTSLSVGNSETKQPDPIQTRTVSLSLRQIKDDIASVPPYQRRDKQRYYIGQQIDWQGKLASVHPEDKDGNVSVMLNIEGQVIKGLAIVPVSDLCSCDVPLDKYPQLKFLPEGSPVRITGKIAGFVLTVDIEDATLYF